ncbi:MAG: TPM domain-containing protein, partial [Nanoarchaeota archaeon]
MKLLSAILVFLLLISTALALDVYPRPTTLVNDHAGVLSAADVSSLEAQLQEIQASGRAEIAVLLIPTLETDSIEDYSIRTVESWKLGTAEQDNGLLITIAVEDHQYRIEVGYGLEGSLNDARVGRIGREIFVPAFQENDYAGGLSQAIIAMDGILQNDPDIIKAVDAAPELPFTLLFIITMIAGTIVSAIAWKQPNKKRTAIVLGIGDIIILVLVFWLISYFFIFAIFVLIMTAFPPRNGFIPIFFGGRGGSGGGSIGGGGGFGGGGSSG